MSCDSLEPEGGGGHMTHWNPGGGGCHVTHWNLGGGGGGGGST